MTNQVIPGDAVEAAIIRARCLECDRRYYEISARRAREWADAHAKEQGHVLDVSPLEGGNND